jgi:hypothetical protein
MGNLKNNKKEILKKLEELRWIKWAT